MLPADQVFVMSLNAADQHSRCQLQFTIVAMLLRRCWHALVMHMHLHIAHALNTVLAGRLPQQCRLPVCGTSTHRDISLLLKSNLMPPSAFTCCQMSAACDVCCDRTLRYATHVQPAVHAAVLSSSLPSCMITAHVTS